MGISVRPTVRAAVFEDGVAIRNLHTVVGYRGEIRDDWPWLWKYNPAWAAINPSPSIGWVLEAEGRIVGYLGSIPLLCRYGEKILLAAATSGFAVDHAYRGYGLLLAEAFFNQIDVDILLNTSANGVSSRVYQRFKAVPLPQKDYDNILFWVLRPRDFIAAAIRRRGFDSILCWIASTLAAGLLRADIAIRNRKPRRGPNASQRQSDIRLLDISEIGPEFDDLWFRKTNEEHRLISYRTAEVLRWHFAWKRAKVVCCRRGTELVGYAVVIRDDVEDFHLLRSKIVDLFVEKNDPQIVDQLLEAAYRQAMNDGSHVLEVMGFPQSIREVFLKNSPYSRSAPNMPYFFRARESDMQTELQHADAWYACPFDGDASL